MESANASSTRPNPSLPQLRGLIVALRGFLIVTMRSYVFKSGISDCQFFLLRMITIVASRFIASSTSQKLNLCDGNGSRGSRHAWEW